MANRQIEGNTDIGFCGPAQKPLNIFQGTDNSSRLKNLSTSTIHFYNLKPHRFEQKPHHTLKIMFLKSNNIKLDVMLGQ